MSETPRYHSATCLDDVVDRLAALGPRAQLVAGATDWLRRRDAADRGSAELVIDLSRIEGLDRIAEDGDTLRLGPLVTHSQILRSPAVLRSALPVAQASLALGTPQVRNRGTLAGAIVSAHPGSDPLPALIALDAAVTLRSTSGTRVVAVADLAAHEPMRDDELIAEIAVPRMGIDQRGLYASVRAELGASLNLAAVLRFATDGHVDGAILVMGGRAPRVLRDGPLVGQRLGDAALAKTARLAADHAGLDDDPEPGDGGRRALLEVLVRRALQTLREGRERSRWPTRPVRLGRPEGSWRPDAATTHTSDTPIVATVNGRRRSAPRGAHRTLLEWLREGLGLADSKDGCAEGVCGACTVRLDGVAVVACLVPAPRAHGAVITTAEGLAASPRGAALRRSFREAGAVQCGYCTPGMMIASDALLEDTPRPDEAEIEAALAGNLCRCTGYAAIRRALRRAGEAPGARER